MHVHVYLFCVGPMEHKPFNLQAAIDFKQQDSNVNTIVIKFIGQGQMSPKWNIITSRVHYNICMPRYINTYMPSWSVVFQFSADRHTRTRMYASENNIPPIQSG